MYAGNLTPDRAIWVTRNFFIYLFIYLFVAFFFFFFFLSFFSFFAFFPAYAHRHSIVI